jgi:hypothetical protein
MNIYFIKDERGPIKIGISCDINKRITGMQTSNPYKLELLLYIQDCKYTEKQLHLMFNKYRIRGEWFEPAPELLEFIDKIRLENPKSFDGRDYVDTGKYDQDFEDRQMSIQWRIFKVKPYSVDEKIFLLNNYKNMSVTELADRLDRSEKSIIKQLSSLITGEYNYKESYDYYLINSQNHDDRVEVYYNYKI